MPCCSFHDLLAVLLRSSYADVCSNLGHPSENLRWATLREIRRFYKKKWPSTRDFDFALLDAFSPNTFFFEKIAANIRRGADLFSLHSLLTNTDAHSDSDHQSFSLLWATLRAIRLFFLINLN